MKGVVFFFLLGVILFGAAGEYVIGRILLPEVGLTAPGYITWVWVMAFAVVFGFPISLASAALRSS